jgi:hypothetical protein
VHSRLLESATDSNGNQFQQEQRLLVSAYPCHHMTELKGMPRSGRSMEGTNDFALLDAPDSRAPATLAIPRLTDVIVLRSIQDWMLLPGHATFASWRQVMMKRST